MVLPINSWWKLGKIAHWLLAILKEFMANNSYLTKLLIKTVLIITLSIIDYLKIDNSHLQKQIWKILSENYL
jgi:hypothetical protein